MTTNGKCPPHAYRASGKPYRPVTGHKTVLRDHWTNGGRRRVKRKHRVEVYGPMTQAWFCTKCADETTSVAGLKR